MEHTWLTVLLLAGFFFEQDVPTTMRNLPSGERICRTFCYHILRFENDYSIRTIEDEYSATASGVSLALISIKIFRDVVNVDQIAYDGEPVPLCTNSEAASHSTFDSLRWVSGPYTKSTPSWHWVHHTPLACCSGSSFLSLLFMPWHIGNANIG